MKRSRILLCRSEPAAALFCTTGNERNRVKFPRPLHFTAVPETVFCVLPHTRRAPPVTFPLIVFSHAATLFHLQNFDKWFPKACFDIENLFQINYNESVEDEG